MNYRLLLANALKTGSVLQSRSKASLDSRLVVLCQAIPVVAPGLSDFVYVK
jgi:hypothetical protein